LKSWGWDLASQTTCRSELQRCWPVLKDSGMMLLAESTTTHVHTFAIHDLLRLENGHLICPVATDVTTCDKHTNGCILFTLWLLNIAMENCPFIDVIG